MFSEDKKNLLLLKGKLDFSSGPLEPQLQETFNFWKAVLIKRHWSFIAVSNNPNSWSGSREYWQNKQQWTWGGRLWQEQSDRKMKCSARTAEARKNKKLLLSSFILELLEDKLLLEEPFLDCSVTEGTWFRHRAPREEPGGVGVCAAAGAVSSFDPGALLLPSTEHWEPLWFDLSL